ncbi:GIY-YIG nuclease family protein [Metamycoplasma equirhinis]|uniref:GIY-YIG nuclease family protein n=1 Tax=Metamycoplasma equirhinis TaxID=92402 RepID=UPI0035944217
MIEKELIKDVPTSPGVYLWKDKDGNVIYVGKAKNLKSRMLQYFDPKMQNSYKTPKMLQNIASFSTIVLSSDREAFIQERKLIQKYHPFYNVLFPSQSSFPYIRVKLNSNKLVIDLKNKYEQEKNAIYYGPLPNNKNFKPLIRYLNHLLLAKDGQIIKNQTKKFAEEQFYKAKEIMKFGLNFKKDLENKLDSAINSNMFEQAKFYNDILDLLNYNTQDQHIFIKSQKQIDVFGIYQATDFVLIHCMLYRERMLISEYDFTLEIRSTLENLINEFLSEFYSHNWIPDQILLSQEFPKNSLEFEDKIIFSQAGMINELISKAKENAENNASLKITEYKNMLFKTKIAQEKLAIYLKTKTENIIMFDNSFVHGTNEIIGGAIWFYAGKPYKKNYRFYNLDCNTLRNADVEYMRQTSFNYLKEFKDQIDVIFADGNIMQIQEIKNSMESLNINIPIFGLVKNEYHETKYLIDENDNEIIIDDPNVFNLLARMQTEVDRFAKTMHSKKHLKSMLNNPLLLIKGVGKKTIEKLLASFNTYQDILNATEEELCKVVSPKIAKLIMNEKF